jgi:hypothetical protein
VVEVWVIVKTSKHMHRLTVHHGLLFWHAIVLDALSSRERFNMSVEIRLKEKWDPVIRMKPSHYFTRKGTYETLQTTSEK